MSEKKKKKSKIISFRVNEDEHDVIVAVAESANMTVSEYLKVRALNGKIQQPKVSSADLRAIVPELTKLTGQIGRMGNNVNQIAKVTRREDKYSFGMVSFHKSLDVLENMDRELEEIKTEVQRLWHTLK